MLLSFKQLFFPPFLYVFVCFYRGMMGYLKLRSLPRILYNSKDKESLFILGNGPSLKDTVEEDVDILKSNNCIAVNFFAISSYFELIRPSTYLIVDSAFFLKPEDSADDLREKLLKMISVISKINWDIDFIVPISERNSYFCKTVCCNKHISVKFFNNAARMGDALPQNYLFWLWNHNIISPLSQTVINTCLSLAITMRYSHIYIVGADSSWHEDYWMDQNDNKLYIWDKHYYGTKKTLAYANADHTKTSSIHEELYNDSVALKNYWILADYAKYNNVKVYNASAYSWIDAFERKKIEDRDD